MYSITDLRKDTLVQIEDVPYRVVEYAQKQMGRGGSIVNVKLKNLIDGNVLDRTFKGNEKINPAQVINKKMQFLYQEADQLYFMDTASFEQISADKSVAPAYKYLKEGAETTLQIFKGKVINVELPVKVDLTVQEADPGVKGDSVSNIMKNAVLETGARIQVPLFIKPGDQIVVDTRDGSYVERLKN